MNYDLSLSNSLADLAARIRAEHEAVQDALNSAVMRAMAAGDLLTEAKGRVKHGEWLPWLKEHCEISDRTAQIYMKLANDRPRLEDMIGLGIDLSINQAAGLATLSLEEKDAYAAMKQAFAKLTVDYDQWAGRGADARKVAGLFALFLTERCGYGVEGAIFRAEYDLAGSPLSGGGFVSLDDLLGEPGDTWRMAHLGQTVTESFKTNCRSFIAERMHMTEADIEARFGELQSQERPVESKRKRKPKTQRVADLPVSKEDRREAILRRMAELQRELEELV